MGLKRQLLLVGVLAVSFLVSLPGYGFAQEEHSSAGNVSDTSATGPMEGINKEVASNRQEFEQYHQTVLEHANAARDEEQILIKQVNEALKAGDFESAKKIRAHLKGVRDKNFQQRDQDMQQLNEYSQNFTRDMPEASGKGQDIKDRREDSRDRKDDFRDRREDVKDRREDFRDRKDDFKDRPHHNDQGVRDHGAGVGAGKGQGGAHRAGGQGPRGGGGGKR